MATASPVTSDHLSDKEASLEAGEIQKTPLYNSHIDVSGVDERKLLWKIDLTLIPWLSLLYLLSFLDRTSIGKYVLDSHFSSLDLAKHVRQCKGIYDDKMDFSISPALHSFTAWRKIYTSLTSSTSLH